MEIKKGREVQWIDIEKPTEKELQWLEKEFDIHPVIIDELRGPSARAKVEAYKDYLFFIYYFPLYDVEDEASVRTEIDFIITKDSVITVHYEPLKELLDGFGVKKMSSSLELMYDLVEHLINFEERQLRHVREKVEARRPGNIQRQRKRNSRTHHVCEARHFRISHRRASAGTDPPLAPY
jgi:Mg2+ and Co2+ transporter CorA